MNFPSISALVVCVALVEALLTQSDCIGLHEQCDVDLSVGDATDLPLSLLQRGAYVQKRLDYPDRAKAGLTQSSKNTFAKWNSSLASGVDPWMILTLVLITCTVVLAVYITVGSLGKTCQPFEDMVASWSMLFDWKLASWNTLAAVFLCMALYGRHHFLSSPYLVGKSVAALPAGYSRLELVGLVCLIWCLPAAAILGVAAVLSYYARSKSSTWVLFGAIVCGWFLVYAAFECRDLICIISPHSSHCIGEVDPIGLRLLTGIEEVLVNAVFLAMFIWIGLRSSLGKSTTTSATSQLFDMKAPKYQRSKIFAGATLAIIINPCLFLLTAVFPGCLLTLGSVNMHTYVSTPSMGAELPIAWMKTTNFRISDDIVLKFFPDTIIFYSLLEVFALTALATILFPGLQRFFARPMFQDFTVGEIMSGCVLTTATYFWVLYWYVEHSYNGGNKDINDSTLERLFRTWGQTAVLFLSLALLPASKSSIWLKALGVSWEKALWVHRWLGYASLACIACHFLSFWAACIFKWHTFPHDAFAMQLFYPLNGYSNEPSYPNFTIALMQLVAYPAIFMIGIPALKRRGRGNSWEWFKYLHFVFLVLIPAVLLHAASSPYFLVGGIAFWIFDAALRYAGVADLNTQLLRMEVNNADGGVTKLTFSRTHSEPGQFAWIKVPSISEWEWHPFSLSSSPNDGYSEMCIKSMGPNTFTDQLFQLTKTLLEEKAKPFKIMVDGPHGLGFGPLLADHDGVLLIAGGIGITPMHSTFRTLAQMAQRKARNCTIQSVNLVWAAKSSDFFEIFADSLDFCLTCSDVMSISLFATENKDLMKMISANEGDRFARRSNSRLSAQLRKHLKLGRPNFEETMQQMCTQLKGGSCLVLACGPESMVASAASAASIHENISFHDMLFRL